ncbi:type VII secretion system-associated protein [Streptomyces diacarni]|uniref:Type VII secretion system-associated protein n=1 Tax=Streptomyces diacarni TaxID=2800381 RepID=A0A367ESV6_9ACTN|nr:type VII secretion system-associated protein [Streptomyces diacarni]
MSDNGASAPATRPGTDEPTTGPAQVEPDTTAASAAPAGDGATTGISDDDEVLEPPEEFVKAAKLAPNHWLYLTDPAWQGEGLPPDWAVVGQWRSDDDGEIVEWQDNENYQPSPEALGWPEPEDDVDAAIQLATTGYGPAEDVTAALAKAEVAVLVTAGGEPVSASASDGTAVVPIFTSPLYLHAAGRLGFERVRIPALLERLPKEHSLCINSSAPVSMVMTTDGLADLMAAAAELPEEQAADDEPAAEWPTLAPREGAAAPQVSAPAATTSSDARDAPDADEGKNR